jgi:CBS domain-containing protein
MPTRNVPLADAGPHVEDVMLRGPRTYPPETTVAEARAEFENPKVRLLLVARGETYLGAVTRDTIGDELAGDVTLDTLATASAGVEVDPGDPVDQAVELLETRQTDRLPVVEEDGTLVGLVCFNRRHGHFCVDD